MRPSAWRLGPVLFALVVCVAASPWGQLRVEGTLRIGRLVADGMRRFGPRKTFRLLMHLSDPDEPELSGLSPDELMAGIASTSSDNGILVSCLGPSSFAPDVEERVAELTRRGGAALPALASALASADELKVHAALAALARGRRGVPPESLGRLDSILTDGPERHLAAQVLWNSGAAGRNILAAAVFHPSEPSFERRSQLVEAARGPFVTDADGAWEILERELSSDEAGARLEAASLVKGVRRRRAEAVPVIAAALERESNAFARSRLISALKEFGPESRESLPVLRRLASSQQDSEDAAWAIFEMTRDAQVYEALLKRYERGAELPVLHLGSFVVGCPRSERARALVERDYVANSDYGDFWSSRWDEALSGCLGEVLTDAKRRELEGRRKRVQEERIARFNAERKNLGLRP